MKKFLIAILALIGASNAAQAQFLDQFERMLDKITGNESEPEVTLPEGRSYGANPGLQVMCQKAGVKGDMAYLLLTFKADTDTVCNVVMDSSDPAATLSLGMPQVADSTVVFIVSPAYREMGKTDMTKQAPQVINVATPQAQLCIPAGELVDVMAIYYDFPKKVKRIDRLDIRMKQAEPGQPEKYFGFTLDGIALKRTKK